jgi:hypothetical protein
MAKEKDLMLTKEEIHSAIEESQKVKEKYPAFWKFYEMLLEMNQGLLQLQEREKKK